MPARHVLDQIQSLAALEGLAGDPDRYAGALAGELPPASSLPELEARDAALAAALLAIDELATRAMRIRLDHALAADGSIAPPTRRVFAQTVVSYAGQLGLLAQRARDVAARAGARDADRVAELVSEAARATLELRTAVRDPVLALVASLATAAVADADRHARDRQLPDGERKRWSAVRRDLEAVAADPERVAAAPLPARIATIPEQLDEPEPEAAPTIAELLELD